MTISLTIENYKSIGNATLDLRPGLNILVGPNGSGKTCLLSSLKFLRDVFRAGGAQALARQGGALRVYKHGTSQMSFAISASYGLRTYKRKKIPCTLRWRIILGQAGEERIATILDEVVEIVGKYRDGEVRLFSLELTRRKAQKARVRQILSQVSEFGRDLFSSWEYHFPDKSKRQIAEIFASKGPQQDFKDARSEPDRSFFSALARYDQKILEVLELFLFLNEYNIVPDVARASAEQLPFARMLPNGAAVSEVIEALENERYHKLDQAHLIAMDDSYGFFEPIYLRRRLPFFYNPSFHFQRRSRRALVDALANINRELAAAVRPIASVSVSIDPTNGKRFVVFRSEGDTFAPEEVSDGTVKWLCILVSLFVPFSRVYLLEEPENFLHPWMQQRLIAIMREQAEAGNIVFFLSSHSATIINAAQAEEILVVRQGEDGTEISEMEDLDHVKSVLAESDFHLGDLWVSGAIGGVPTDE